MAASRKRADLALEQVGEARDKAARLVDKIDRAMADKHVSLEEISEILDESRDLLQEAKEAQIAVEWTENGERKALAGLTNRGSANAEARDMEIQRRAAEIGFFALTTV